MAKQLIMDKWDMAGLSKCPVWPQLTLYHKVLDSILWNFNDWCNDNRQIPCLFEDCKRALFCIQQVKYLKMYDTQNTKTT